MTKKNNGPKQSGPTNQVNTKNLLWLILALMIISTLFTSLLVPSGVPSSQVVSYAEFSKVLNSANSKITRIHLIRSTNELVVEFAGEEKVTRVSLPDTASRDAVEKKAKEKQIALSEKPFGFARQTEDINYSDLLKIITANPKDIKQVVVINDTNIVAADFTNREKLGRVLLPGKSGEETLLAAAQKAEVKVIAETKPEPTGPESFLQFLFHPLVFGTILLIAVMIFLMRKMAGSGGPMGALKQFQGSPAQAFLPGDIEERFASVAGCDEAIERLSDTVDYLKNPALIRRLGGKPSKGVLLIGPPGTGKTLLARAVAGEAGVPFFSVPGSAFIEMFVGVGSSRVRSVFRDIEKAIEQHGAAILFIDELDAIGRQRGAGLGGGHDEREQTLNQILVEMDGFLQREGVVVLAATNRADILDPALTRPGRFDNHVSVDNPHLVGRKAIFKIHTSEKPLADDVDIDFLARRTTGFSGASIAGACNSAAQVAARRIKKKMVAEGKTEPDDADMVINIDDFDKGIDLILLGEEKRGLLRAMTPDQKRSTAIHEAGHAAVIAYNICEFIRNKKAKELGVDPKDVDLDKLFAGGNVEIPIDYPGELINKITIVPKAKALGFAEMVSQIERIGYDEDELLSMIACAYAGRQAQLTFLDKRDSGAQNDFERGWALAEYMVCKLGMSDLGPISVASGEQSSIHPFLAKALSAPSQRGTKLLDQVDDEIRKIVDKCQKKAEQILTDNKCRIERVANALLERETILGTEFWRLWIAPGCEQCKS